MMMLKHNKVLKKVTLLICLCLCSIGGLAQEEKNGSKESVAPKYKSLKEKLQARNKARKARVEAYIAKHPEILAELKQRSKEESKTIQLYDIINGKPVYRSTMDIQANNAMNVTPLHPGGSSEYNLDGTGVLVGVWDGGVAETVHDEFLIDPQNQDSGSKITIGDDGSVPEAGIFAPAFHATHVSGIIVASGIRSEARGAAPNARIKSYNWRDDTLEALDAITDTHPIILSNHSYGLPVFRNNQLALDVEYIGAYNEVAQNWDHIHYENPFYLMVIAAGNEGTSEYIGGLGIRADKLTAHGVSKNSLVVANANPFYIQGNPEIIIFANTASSQGPTNDLRIKPDIAADGTDLVSTVAGNEYQTNSGTSMAAPALTGSLALIQQYYKSQFDVFMRSSTLKALVCHTAIDDDEVLNPDHILGWGFIDALGAVELVSDSMQEDPTTVIQELTLEQGSTYTLEFSAEIGAQIKATICWTDPAGRIDELLASIPNDSTPDLVNNLDIKITYNEDGTEFFPWRLEYNSQQRSITSSRGINNVDNVERIDFTATATGTYTITVSHQGNLLNAFDDNPNQDYDQDFSLVVSGVEGFTLSNPIFDIKNHITLYPNPARDKVNIQFDRPSLGISNLEIIDINGRMIKYLNLPVETQSHQLTTQTLEAGIYFIRIKTSQGYEVVKKLIIEK